MPVRLNDKSVLGKILVTSHNTHFATHKNMDNDTIILEGKKIEFKRHSKIKDVLLTTLFAIFLLIAVVVASFHAYLFFSEDCQKLKQDYWFMRAPARCIN